MSLDKSVTFLDCTLRDGGYYNQWDFSAELVRDYLLAMDAAQVDAVEIGFRSLFSEGFKGAFAYTTDQFLSSLDLPPGITIGVMVNGAELMDEAQQERSLKRLFPIPASQSKVKLVRVACHASEFEAVLPVSHWLHERGYTVGFNLMQVADKTEAEIKNLAFAANSYPVDVLYFADSLGSMNPERCREIVSAIRSTWSGAIGIHTHDNMGLALQNTLSALQQGVTWVDSTVTGMGRGPGNARTEELAVEIAELRGAELDLLPLMRVIRSHFRPMQVSYGWGTNTYYYLAGKRSIHPSYIQQMLSDSRYEEEDILAAISRLSGAGGSTFNITRLDAARGPAQAVEPGNWNPADIIGGREVLVLGSGPSVDAHRPALESYIKSHRPYVMSLNAQAGIDVELIDAYVACHPVRLLADWRRHASLTQPLITPAAAISDGDRKSLGKKVVLDFGMQVEPSGFEFSQTHCRVPVPLAAAYALSVATSGAATRIYLAGFDGYSADDPRNLEMQSMLSTYQACDKAVPVVSVTPTNYSVCSRSIYAM